MHQTFHHGGGNLHEESITLNAADDALLLVIKHGFRASCLSHCNHISAKLCLLATPGIEPLQLAFLEKLLQALLERPAKQRPGHP